MIVGEGTPLNNSSSHLGAYYLLTEEIFLKSIHISY